MPGICRCTSVSRRTLLAGLAAGSLVGPQQVWAATPRKIQAIAFDAFTIFDPRSVTATAREVFPQQGDKLAAIWFQKLFDYTWIATAAGQYQDFETLAGEALRFAADSLQLGVPDPAFRALVARFSALDIWPDAKPVLARLKANGIRMALLSNMSKAMLASNIMHAGLDPWFEPSLSTDRVQSYKPAPVAYAMAIAAFGLPREAIGFAAYGGWDAIGATWFGYRTAWINRLGLPAERLAAPPAIVSSGLDGAVKLAGISSEPLTRSIAK